MLFEIIHYIFSIIVMMAKKIWDITKLMKTGLVQFVMKYGAWTAWLLILLDGLCPWIRKKLNICKSDCDQISIDFYFFEINPIKFFLDKINNNLFDPINDIFGDQSVIDSKMLIDPKMIFLSFLLIPWVFFLSYFIKVASVYFKSILDLDKVNNKDKNDFDKRISEEALYRREFRRTISYYFDEWIILQGKKRSALIEDSESSEKHICVEFPKETNHIGDFIRWVGWPHEWNLEKKPSIGTMNENKFIYKQKLAYDFFYYVYEMENKNQTCLKNSGYSFDECHQKVSKFWDDLGRGLINGHLFPWNIINFCESNCADFRAIIYYNRVFFCNYIEKKIKLSFVDGDETDSRAIDFMLLPYSQKAEYDFKGKMDISQGKTGLYSIGVALYGKNLTSRYYKSLMYVKLIYKLARACLRILKERIIESRIFKIILKLFNMLKRKNLSIK